MDGEGEDKFACKANEPCSDARCRDLVCCGGSGKLHMW